MVEYVWAIEKTFYKKNLQMKKLQNSKIHIEKSSSKVDLNNLIKKLKKKKKDQKDKI